MYGGDEVSTSSPPDRSQTQQQQQYREVNVDDKVSSKNNSNQKKIKESSITIPKIITTKPADSIVSPDHSQSFSVSGNDIEAAFDSINDYKTSTNKSKDNETSDSFFGLSTIKENLGADENTFNTNSSKPRTDVEIDFDNYFSRMKQPVEEKKPKKTAPIFQHSKTTHHSKDQKRSTLVHSDDIQTPSTSISVQVDNNPMSSTTLPVLKQSDNKQDSTDEDVDEVLGTLEVNICGKCTHTYIHILHSYLLFIQKFFRSMHVVTYSCMYVYSVFSHSKLSIRKTNHLI